MTSPTDILWLDPGDTDLLEGVWAHIGVSDLGLSNLEALADPDAFEMNVGILVLAVNKTGTDLEVEEAKLPWGGDWIFRAPTTIVAPPAELGAGASAVAAWMVQTSGIDRNPSFVVKLKASPATGGHPVYIGADISQVFSTTYTASVRNEADHGDAQAYYDQIVRDTDYGKAKVHSGVVKMQAWDAATSAIGLPVTGQDIWIVVATIG